MGERPCLGSGGGLAISREPTDDNTWGLTVRVLNYNKGRCSMSDEGRLYTASDLARSCRRVAGIRGAAMPYGRAEQLQSGRTWVIRAKDARTWLAGRSEHLKRTDKRITEAVLLGATNT